MSELKPGWERVKFGDVVRLVKETCKDPVSAGIERVIGLEHIEPGDLRVRRWADLADGTTFTTRVRPGQVLFGKRRAYQRKVAVADFDAICSGDIYVFESVNQSRLAPELLPFLCQTDAFFRHAVDTSAGSLSPRTNWSSLADFEFALPPLVEQKRIIQAATSLQAVTETRMNLGTAASDLALSLREDMLSRAKIRRTCKVSLVDLCKVCTGKLDSNAAIEDGAFPFFTCDPVPKRINESAFNGHVILLAGNNAQGNFWVKTYSGEFNAYQRTYVLQPDSERADLDYVAQCLTHSLTSLKHKSTGSSTKFLTMGMLREVNINLPPLQEQRELVRPVLLAMAAVEELACSVESALIFQQRLLAQAMCGGVTS